MSIIILPFAESIGWPKTFGDLHGGAAFLVERNGRQVLYRRTLHEVYEGGERCNAQAMSNGTHCRLDDDTPVREVSAELRIFTPTEDVFE